MPKFEDLPYIVALPLRFLIGVTLRSLLAAAALMLSFYGHAPLAVHLVVGASHAGARRCGCFGLSGQSHVSPRLISDSAWSANASLTCMHDQGAASSYCFTGWAMHP